VVAERQVAVIAPLNAPTPAFVASAQPNGTVVLTSVSPAPVPAGKDLELWILRPGATRVAPLGVLSASGGSVRLPAAPATGTQLLISLEPAGGSPTGQPTGPVLYGGTLTGA
jgi:anti-sigma-K factor RskA